eukprot:56890-Amphidinium_carterae.1
MTPRSSHQVACDIFPLHGPDDADPEVDYVTLIRQTGGKRTWTWSLGQCRYCSAGACYVSVFWICQVFFQQSGTARLHRLAANLFTCASD